MYIYMYIYIYIYIYIHTHTHTGIVSFNLGEGGCLEAPTDDSDNHPPSNSVMKDRSEYCWMFPFARPDNLVTCPYHTSFFFSSQWESGCHVTQRPRSYSLSQLLVVYDVGFVWDVQDLQGSISTQGFQCISEGQQWRFRIHKCTEILR